MLSKGSGILQKALRLAVGLFGVVFVALALGFLIDPVPAASKLGVGPLGPLGVATLRADLWAFFGTGGILSVASAVRNDARLLTAPLLMIAMALAGRLITVAVSGFDQTMVPPMVAEAIIAVLLVLGYRNLATPRIAPT